jgi:hypothetical protein
MVEMFSVNVYRNGEIVKSEKVATLPELKSFLYGIREIVSNDDIVAMVHAPWSMRYGMIVQEMGKPTREGLSEIGERGTNRKFLNKFKKSAYA